MKLKELTKNYENKIAVDHVTLDFEPGKITSIIGPNGAGKSTVLSMISRLLKYDAGQAIFEGTEISSWNSKALAKKLAILSQTNQTELKLTIRELVNFGRFPYSGNHLNEDDDAIVDRSLAYMELTDIQDSFLDELSGGQRQRAYIAMILAQDTPYILLDEPTASLDIYHAVNLMRIIRKLSSELNKTVIIVLHEINYAAFYSDYILAMKNGKIAAYGTVDQVITQENLHEIYQADFEILEVHGKPMCIYY
ncbi:MAG: ABC transporter ATP-binding protein [Bulleidia sp.]